MYFLLAFFFSNGYALGYDKFYFIPQLDDTHVDDTVISVFKLDTCFLYDESTSCKYVYYNDSHIQSRTFQGKNCNENQLSTTKFVAVKTYLTHVQDQIDQCYTYYISYVSTDCGEPYLYVFYNNKHCNICGNFRHYINIDENKVFKYSYSVELGIDLECTMKEENQYIGVENIPVDLCVKNGQFPWEGVKIKINPEKQERCENATDEIGILFAFVFLMLILI